MPFCYAATKPGIPNRSPAQASAGSKTRRISHAQIRFIGDVVRRTNEFGIRMALGAQAGDVLRLVLASTVSTVAAGLTTSLILSAVLARVYRPNNTPVTSATATVKSNDESRHIPSTVSEASTIATPVSRQEIYPLRTPAR